MMAFSKTGLTHFSLVDFFIWISPFLVLGVEFRLCFKRVGAQFSVDLALAYGSSSSEFEPNSRRNLLNRKRDFNAQSHHYQAFIVRI